ncbi:MAG: response regulator transcription factor [Sporichthyaceae bacterium]
MTRGHAVDIAANREDVHWLVETAQFDALLLFATEAPADMIATLRTAAEWSPMLVVLPDSRTAPRVVADLLDAGADDVMRDPWHIEELHARVRSLARRRLVARPTILQVADLVVDPARLTVHRGEHAIDLQPRKIAVLVELMKHPAQILTRTELIDRVFAGDYDGTSNVVDSYVSHLRAKLDKPFGRNTIKTIRGVGYWLDPEA